MFYYQQTEICRHHPVGQQLCAPHGVIVHVLISTKRDLSPAPSGAAARDISSVSLWGNDACFIINKQRSIASSQ